MNTILRLLPLVDLLLLPIVLPAAWLFKLIRSAGVQRLPLCRQVFYRVGMFPLRNHYYEPQFDHRTQHPPFSAERTLPGIEWNIAGQLALLKRLTYASELAGLPLQGSATREFHLKNGNFESGDAEYWYQLIRALKPKRIFEVGSGYSTLMAAKAIARNRADDPGYSCRHLCIEPYEMPWLDDIGVKVIRQRIETLEVAFFAELEANDILFIDSSHVIRPQGDVLFEFLQLLPTLAKGVVVHVHDIFTPRNYLDRWLVDEVRFWNEQYLLEAFLSHNRDWQIIGALNLLHHRHFAELQSVAPYLTPEREPGSFYLQKMA